MNDLFESPSLDAIGSMFDAAATFHRADLWAALAESAAIEVTIPELGVDEAFLFYLDEDQEESGTLLLLPDRRAYDELCAILRGEAPMRLPRHLALSFTTVRGTPAAWRREVMRGRWSVANAKAYPLFMAINFEGESRGPDACELAVLEAVTRALVPYFESERAAEGQTFIVRASDGPVRVTLA